MEDSKLREEIIELIADVTETDIKRDDVSASFIEGVDVDSLMALEIVAALEKKYKIEIKEEDLPKLGTMDDIISLVGELIKEKQKKPKGKKKIVRKSKSKKKPSKGKRKTPKKKGIKK